MTPTPRESDPAPEALDALDRTLDHVLAGEDEAHALAATVRRSVRREVPVETAAAHLAAIRAQAASPEARPDPDGTLFSPERSPEPDPRLSTGEIVPIEPARRRREARRGGRRALVAVVAAMLLLTLGSSAALAASAETKPGDALYGVKRAAERISLAMRRSPESKAGLHLKFAERRLAEIEALAAAGKDVSDLVDDFSADLEAAGEAKADTLLAKILETTRKHIAHLTEILGQVPEQAHQGLERAIENAERQSEKAEQRRQDKLERDREKGKPDSPGKSGDAPGKKGGG